MEMEDNRHEKRGKVPDGKIFDDLRAVLLDKLFACVRSPCIVRSCRI